MCHREAGQGAGRRKTKLAGDGGKGKVGKSPHTHRLFTASQRPSLANDFLISLFYHVYCNARQEPLQRNELLCSLFTEDCDDALFFEHFFLMDAKQSAKLCFACD